MRYKLIVNNRKLKTKSVNRGFSFNELEVIRPALITALRLANFNGKVKIYRGRPSPNYTEETPNAEISWFPNLFTPKIVIAPEVFIESDTHNHIGITLTHELTHAKQGVFRIFWESLVWYITGRNGYPPFEEEAYNAVNLWWDNKKLF